MRKKILFVLLSFIAVTVNAQDKLAQDKAAIKSLVGYYEVTFNYAETFATDSNYKFKPRYESHGNEWVVIAEETPTKIVLQHILVLGKDMAMKHWREDWTYEDPTTLAYDKDNTWHKVTLQPAQVKGTWTQKVFQVDDGPRYEGRGTWTHVDGKHQWQSETDSPLPRRESARTDYNVLNRLNRVYMTKDGWMFEQDNDKVNRTATGDKLIVKEKGEEQFFKTDAAYFADAEKWWNTGQQDFWKIVRSNWADIFNQNAQVKLKQKVDNKPLYEPLFAMAEQAVKEKWTAEKSKTASLALIQTYVDTATASK